MNANAKLQVWQAAAAIVLCLAGLAHAGQVLSYGEHSFCDAGRICAVDVAANGCATVVVRSDGTLAASGYTGDLGALPKGNGFIAVDIGRRHGIALRWDRSIECFGTDAAIIADTPTGNNFIAVAAGDDHCLALTEDGLVLAWGSNSHGQTEVPVVHDTLWRAVYRVPFEAISARGNHSVGILADGRLVAWGDNSYGQCDVQPGNGYTKVSAGRYNCLALDGQGEVVTWGDGQYGDIPAGGGFLDVAAGDGYDLAIAADGSLVAWGLNENGELQVPQGNDFISTKAGRNHAVAMRADGSIVGWGCNMHQQSAPPGGGDFIAVKGCYGGSPGPWWLGLRSDGTLAAWCCNDSDLDGPPIPPGNGFRAIDVERGHAIALKWNGEVVYWRCDGAAAPALEGGDFVAVSAGGNHVAALRVDGSVVVVGRNTHGQMNVPEGPFLAVAAGGDHCIALRMDGSVTGWGGADSDLIQITAPGFIAIDAHENANLALHRDGSIYAWGDAPPAPAGNDFVAISAGERHCMALKRDGTVVEWGEFTKGRPVMPSWVGPVAAIDSVHTSSAAVRGYFRPVAPSGRTQTVNVIDPRLLAREAAMPLETGDEIAVLCGDMVVGSMIVNDMPVSDGMTAQLENRRMSGYHLDGAVDGTEMRFHVRRARTGQVLDAIAWDLATPYQPPVFREGDAITVVLTLEEQPLPAPAKPRGALRLAR